jgi:hypothetical protein
MKLDPGFPDHWKTRQLYNTLGAEAVLSLLRLWGRAQISREWRHLELTPKKLKAVCGFPGDEQELWDALTDRECPWLDQDEAGTFSIHGFEEHQAQVIALWKNGAKGGRPPNPKKENSLPHPLPHPLTPHDSHSVIPIKPNGNQMVLLSDADTNQSMENTPLMIRLGKFFNRRPTTRWSSSERKALKKLIPIDAEDLALLERYYLEEIAQGDDYRRRDLETLLNNWTKEIDRATSHFATPAIR